MVDRAAVGTVIKARVDNLGLVLRRGRPSPGWPVAWHRSRAECRLHLTERAGANLEHRYGLSYVQRRPTGLICTAVTGRFTVLAGAVSITVSFMGVRGWPSAPATGSESHVRTATTPDEQHRCDVESMRIPGGRPAELGARDSWASFRSAGMLNTVIASDSFVETHDKLCSRSPQAANLNGGPRKACDIACRSPHTRARSRRMCGRESGTTYAAAEPKAGPEDNRAVGLPRSTGCRTVPASCREALQVCETAASGLPPGIHHRRPRLTVADGRAAHTVGAGYGDQQQSAVTAHSRRS
jgi:hypothetical protein